MVARYSYSGLFFDLEKFVSSPMVEAISLKTRVILYSMDSSGSCSILGEPFQDAHG
jgi:hypothetical protein